MKDDRYGVLCFLGGAIMALIIMALVMYRPKNFPITETIAALSAVGAFFAGFVSLYISAKTDKLRVLENDRKHVLFLSMIKMPLHQLIDALIKSKIFINYKNIKVNLTKEGVLNKKIIDSMDLIINDFESSVDKFNCINFDFARININYCDQRYLHFISHILESPNGCKYQIELTLRELKNAQKNFDQGELFMDFTRIDISDKYFKTLRLTIDKILDENADDLARLNMFERFKNQLS